MTAHRLGQLVRAGVGTAVLLVALAWSSSVPVRQRGAGRAWLRLSWTARPERIEVCRTLSAEELAEREEHMRQRVECDGRFATYLLRVQSDGRTVHESTARGAGFRHDRPLYVLHELDLAPGVHHLQVSFTRRERTDNDAAAFAGMPGSSSDTGLFAGRAQREAAERERRARAAIPAHLGLDTTVTFIADRAILIWLDPERQRLQLVGEMPR